MTIKNNNNESFALGIHDGSTEGKCNIITKEFAEIMQQVHNGNHKRVTISKELKEMDSTSTFVTAVSHETQSKPERCSDDSPRPRKISRKEESSSSSKVGRKLEPDCAYAKFDGSKSLFLVPIEVPLYHTFTIRFIPLRYRFVFIIYHARYLRNGVNHASAKIRMRKYK
jgi:hypothetical protein